MAAKTSGKKRSTKPADPKKQASRPEPWKNRIIGEGEERPDQLLANPNNWRIHPRQQQSALSGVLDQLGWIQRVIVNKRTGHVIDGHLRVSLAISRNEPSVPVVYVDISEEEELLALSTLDPLSAMAVADSEMLSSVLHAISTDNAAIQGMLSDLAAQNNINILTGEIIGQADAEPQIDAAAELAKKWKTGTGQMWQIGPHRMLIGDCVSPENVERVIGADRPDLVLTDPPYNVGLVYDGKTMDDNKGKAEYETFAAAWVAECQKISDRQIITPGGDNLSFWLDIPPFFYVAPWTKSNPQTHGKVSQFMAWEPVLFFGTKWGNKRHLDTFDFPANFNTKKSTFNHPCPKPLPFWQDLITNYSEKGDIIYDCFLGSGTTLVACQNTGRVCCGLEISPDYAAVCLQRMKDAFPEIKIEKL